MRYTSYITFNEGDVFRTNGYLIPPRVYLITDGKATPPSLISGRDRCKQGDFQGVSVKSRSINICVLEYYRHLKFNILNWN